MMSGLEALLEMLNLSTDEAVTIAVGAVFSPAKLVGIVYGLYKAFSPNHVDTSWKEFVDPQQFADGD